MFIKIPIQCFATLFSLILSISSFAQAKQSSFNKLYSLCGTWRMETKKGLLYESWKKINDSTLLGKSFTINKTDTMMLEEVDLVMRHGKIYYIPKAKGQNSEQPVTFTLKSLAKGECVFENLLHDFPQRIVYRLPVNNILHAWIEGNTSSGVKRSDYMYRKS